MKLYRNATVFNKIQQKMLRKVGRKTTFFMLKIKPKPDYPLKTLYPRAFQTGQNHPFTTILLLLSEP